MESNVSTGVFPATKNNTSSSTHTDSLIVVKLICFGVISVVGTIGNILICATLFRNKRKSSECFILNLALTDLMVCSLGIPLDIYQELHDVWMYGAVLCKVIWPSQTLLVLVSILTLTAMSMERYRAIITPLKPKLKKNVIVKAIIVIWIMGIAIVSPYINSLTFSDGGCAEQWPDMDKDPRYYTLALFVIDYCIPLTIITYCYARIGFRLYKSNIQFNDSSHVTKPKDFSKIQHDARRKRLRRNTRIIKTFAFAVLMFVVCMLPGDIFWMWKSWGQGSFLYERHFQTFSNILLFANSAINPFIFGTCNILLCFQTGCLRREENSNSYSLHFSFGVSPLRGRNRREGTYNWRRVAVRRMREPKATVVWETSV